MVSFGAFWSYFYSWAAVYCLRKTEELECFYYRLLHAVVFRRNWLRNLTLETILRHKKRLNSLSCAFIFTSRCIPTQTLFYDNWGEYTPTEITGGRYTVYTPDYSPDHGQSRCESSPSSFDECRLSTGWPPTPRPSQSTWAVSPPKTCCYHPHPPSPLLLLLSP